MKFIRTLLVLALVIAFSACSRKQQDTSVVNLYAPGTINSHMAERDAALSADGQHFYFSIQLTRQHSAICYATKLKGKWMRPKVADFSGKYMDVEPVFHPDGSLYFCSNRPLPGEDETGDYNIWYVKKVDHGWSEPIALDTIINGANNEFYPSFTSNGDLYFTSTLAHGKGREDLWVSKFDQNTYTTPLNLGDSINTNNFEYNAFIHPQGDYILFTTHGWGAGYGSSDIYVSFKKEDDGWSQPINLGDKVNTAGMEFCPSLSPDGKTLFFTRKTIPEAEGKKWSYFEMLSSFSSLQNGQGNIYYINSDFIMTLK